MYPKIVEEIKHEYYQQNFSNDGQRFVAWYLRNIHLRDPIQAKDDITDGADDKQIDALFVDDDKSTVFVIQGKFLGAQLVDAEPLREVLSSWIQMRDLVRLQEVGNQKLKRKLSEVARALEDDYEVCFELITTAELTESAKQDLSTFQEQLADLSSKDDFLATILVINEDEIRRRYDIALERENPSLSHVLDLSGCSFLPVKVAGTQVVVAVVPLSECLKFPGVKDGTQEGGAVFRPLLECLELLTYFRMDTTRINEALEDRLPKAGIIAQRIEGKLKGMRDYLNLMPRTSP